MIEVTQKDMDRAEQLYNMSDKKICSILDKIKSPEKLLARGLAYNKFNEFHGAWSFEQACKNDEFAVRAKSLGASEEQLHFYVDQCNATYKENCRRRDEKNKVTINELWSKVDPKLTRSIYANTWCAYTLVLPGTRKRISVDIYCDSNGDYYCEILQRRQKKTIYLTTSGRKWTTLEQAKKIIQMVETYQIVDPYNGDHKARVNRARNY